MIVSRLAPSFLLICSAIAFASPAPAAQPVSREQNITHLMLGQRVLVDDGTCPAGQIKQVLGAKMTPTGVARTRTCVSRVGTKR